MKSFKSLLTGRYRSVYVLALIYLAVGVVLRTLLWWNFGRHDEVPVVDMLWILPVGFINDLLQAAYLSLPLAIYLFFMPQRWLTTKWARGLLAFGCVATLTALFFLCASEYFFFEEFNARFNLVAFDYLMYPTEVIGDIRAEYPVAMVLIVAVSLSLAACWGLRRWLFANVQPMPASRMVRGMPFAAQMLLVAVTAALINTDTMASSVSTSLEKSIGWSENRVADELAANGLSSFFRAARTSEIDYRTFYATRSASDNLNALQPFLTQQGGKLTQFDRGSLNRHFAADPNGLGKLNVIVVAEESFGAEFSKLYGSTQDLTPNFDAFAQQSMWFKNMYASGTRTVRGLEAINASFPPIPSVSILRRPNNEGIATWGSVMSKQGYQTSFLYGGYGYFDNMNYFFGHNGYDVVDRTDIKQVRFANIWGVSDEDLFDRALTYYDQHSSSDKPFFSLIMSTSNHKPYTFREGVPGVPATGGGRPAGVRYADYALGYFLTEAKKHAWFDNTLFVVVADHGARVYGKAEIPLHSYEIPMMFYAPKHVRPQRIDTLTGQIDIAPTVLGMLGLEYQAPFFGTNVLTSDPSSRLTFFSHNHDVAVYRDGKLAVLGLGKQVQTLTYRRQDESYAAVAPDVELSNLAIAIYQTAYEQFQAHRYQ